MDDRQTTEHLDRMQKDLDRKIELLDEVEMNLDITVHSVATTRMAGLSTDDLMDYLEHHARAAMMKALETLQTGGKTLKELGFS